MTNRTRRPQTRQAQTLAAVGIAATLLLSACGALPGGGDSAFDDLSEAEKSRVAESYRDCMAEGGLEAQVDYSNGLNIDVNGGDISMEEAMKVEAECEPLLADLDQEFDMTPEQEARLADATAKVQKCLAEDGYVITIMTDGGISLDSDDQPAGFDEAAYAAAEEACFREADPELFEEFEEQFDN